MFAKRFQIAFLLKYKLQQHFKQLLLKACVEDNVTLWKIDHKLQRFIKVTCSKYFNIFPERECYLRNIFQRNYDRLGPILLRLRHCKFQHGKHVLNKAKSYDLQLMAYFENLLQLPSNSKNDKPWNSKS